MQALGYAEGRSIVFEFVMRMERRTGSLGLQPTWSRCGQM